MNLQPSILASCSIPFWLDAVHDIPGAPRGAYWDGGITDYHLHLDYGSMHEGLVLYPHFQKTVIPGWLDKALKHRHRATAHLDKVVLLSPRPEWIATLPNAKLPDRNDFKAYGDDLAGRVRGLEPRAGRKPAPGGRVRRARGLGPAHRGLAAGLRLQFAFSQTHKDGKGSMVMTPRTTGFVTEA